MLSGHGTNEVLTGGQGRDLLIGSTGSAALNAGSSDDILIGGTGFGTLNVDGLDGADTFNVYTGPAVSRNLYINGNLPSGKKKLTDVMNVFYELPWPKIVYSTATQNPSSGLVSLNYRTSNDLIKYDGIENVIIKKQRDGPTGHPASEAGRLRPPRFRFPRFVPMHPRRRRQVRPGHLRRGSQDLLVRRGKQWLILLVSTKMARTDIRC